MKFHLHARVVGGKWLGVFEADTPEEAIEKAMSAVDVSVCHQCSSQIEDPEIDWEDVDATKAPDTMECVTNE